MERREIGSEILWDIFIVIDGIFPYDYEAQWSEITLKASTPGLSENTGRLSVVEYNYSPGTGFGAWYEDLTGIMGVVDEMDVMIFTGLDDRFEDGTIEIRYEGAKAGTFYLPEEFV
jgi:hypothetical protein